MAKAKQQKFQYTDYNMLARDMGRGAANQDNVIDFMRYASKNPDALKGSGMTAKDVQSQLRSVDGNARSQYARVNPGEKSTYNGNYNQTAATDFMRKFNAEGFNNNLPVNAPQYDSSGYMISPGNQVQNGQLVPGAGVKSGSMLQGFPSGAPGNPGQPFLGAMGTAGINAQVKYDDAGRPIRNDYRSMVGQDGRILDHFSMAGQLGEDVNMNQDAYNQIKANALNQGPSDWAKGMLNNQDLLRQNAMDKARTNSLAQAQQQQSMLASRGGMTGAQAALLSRTAMRDGQAAGQGVINQDMQQRNQIGIQDQQRKDEMLKMLPGMDAQQAGFLQQQREYRDKAKFQDVGNAMKDVVGLNMYNNQAFGDSMKEWGAGQTADAQARASGGGKK